MTRPPRPAKKPAKTSEARRQNVLLASLAKDVGTLAGAIVDIQKKVGQTTKDVSAINDEMKSMGDVVRGLAKDVDMITYSTAKSSQADDHIKTELRPIRSDLNEFTARLTTVETKLAS